MIITPAKIHIETVGSGPHLALIHGWGMNGSVWQPVLKKLSRNFTLHIVDLPGMGFSQIISPYHLYSIAEKVAELSFHQDTIAEKVDSNWLHKALKESGRTKESVKRIV